MAIQLRRGDYTDFDPSQLLDGELAVVLENDPDTDDGTALYVGFGDDNVKRVAFADETADVDVATTTTAGVVKPDGTSITVDQDGTIHAAGGGVTYVDIMSPSESASSGKYYCYNSTTIPDFTLEKGAALVIMLIAAPANATGDVYIKINDGDLKRITLYSGLNYKWSNVPLGVPMLIVYDGNKWVMVGEADNPSNRVFSCVSTTAANANPKAVDVNVSRITTGMTAILTLTNANTVPLQYLQLQVNCNMTQDYANIRKNGAVLTEADNLKANVPYVLQFDGTYWELIGAIDDSVSPSDTAPAMDGTASAGSSTDYARADHVHPTDTSRASASDLSSHTGNSNIHVTAAERSAWNGKLDASLKGAANGVAELDASGKVPSSQLPSYVDDVLEYATISVFPATGETGKIYVATSTNETYRWSGSAYVSISNPIDYATQAEAEAGVENTHVMTPLRVKQAIAANVSEYALPPMSPTTRGGARLGSGLSMDGDVLSVALESESDGTDAGPIVELTAKGWATQDGTPSPDYPQEIQVARGHEVTGKTGRYVDLVVKQGNTTLSTTPIPLPSRGWAAGLPDGTADTLTLDGAGKVVWEEATNEVTFDGSSDEGWNQAGVYTNNARYSIAADAAFNKSDGGQLLCSHLPEGNAGSDSVNIDLHGTQHLIQITVPYLTASDFKTWLSTHPVTVLYPLATPVTEDMGYVDLPEIPEGATLTISELDALNVRYVVDDAAVTLARQWYDRARSEYEGRLSTLESIVAGLV